MGELHLDIIVDRLRREYKVECDVGAPQVLISIDRLPPLTLASDSRLGERPLHCHQLPSPVCISTTSRADRNLALEARTSDELPAVHLSLCVYVTPR